MNQESQANLRLLSLLPSATEIVHGLGLGSYQVGRSHECDYPPQVKSLPVCTWPAISVDGSSRDIDRSVKERLLAALSVYGVDAQRIAELRPTHIITQTQCKVCAVNLEDVQLAMTQQAAASVSLISLESFSLAGVWSDIQRVASACGCEMAGQQLIASLQTRMSAIRERAKQRPTSPTIGCIEWLDPLMASGNWVPEMIDMAGGWNLFGNCGQHSPWLQWEQLIGADPDILIALPCGFDLKRTRSEMQYVVEKVEWPNLRAVQAGQVFVCDGNQFLNRPGPRLVESLQILGEIIHPDLFAPSFENVGWERF